MRRTVAAPISSISASPCRRLSRFPAVAPPYPLFIRYICFLSTQIESINGASAVMRGGEPARAKDTARGRRDMIRRSFLLTAAAAFTIAATAAQPAAAREQWTKEQANSWYDKQP